MEKPEGYLTLEHMIELIDEGNEKPFEGLILAQIIDVATDYRASLRIEEKAIKAKKDVYKVMEEAILQAMKDSGTEENPLMVAGGLQSTARISETKIPSVKDWDLFYKYIADNDAFHLIQKRASAAAWLDECKIEGLVPGTEEFIQRKISLRKN
jgi:hypothetical protein